jgi:hypothetical protein
MSREGAAAPERCGGKNGGGGPFIVLSINTAPRQWASG